MAALLAADETALLGRPSRLTAIDVGSWWASVDLEHDSWLLEEDGRPVAAGWFERYGPLGIYLGVVAQGAKGRGLGGQLVDLGESRAVAAGAERAHSFFPAPDVAAAELFESRGYREVRRFYDMAIELTEPVPEPSLPDGLAIDVFVEEDARAFHDALDEAFQDHWEHHPRPFEEWWEEKLAEPDYDPTLWFLIRDGGEVAATIRNDPVRNGGGYVGAIGVRRAVARARPGEGAAPAHVPGVPAARADARHARRRRGEPHGRDEALRARRHARGAGGGRVREGARVSLLRGKCPTCHGYTAVAIGPDYECHSCGRTFSAGLVRVPRAWGDGGEPMIEAAGLPLDYPEVAVVEEDSLIAQTLAVASDLPVRPLVLGGCCCSHIGAVEALSARHDRLGVIWLDAHGDLNTPETSPSGNDWGMPLRMLIDGGAVDPQDVALVGARNLDPPEVEYIAAAGIHDNAAAVLDRVDAVYVALDCDVFEPSELTVFMPEPGGPTLAEIERILGGLRESGAVVGAGLTGLAPDPANVEKLERLCAAIGF